MTRDNNFKDTITRLFGSEYSLPPDIAEMLQKRSIGISIDKRQTPALTDLYSLYEATSYLRKQAAYATLDRENVPMGSEPIVDDVRGRTQREVTADGVPHPARALESHLHAAMADEDLLRQMHARLENDKSPKAIMIRRELPTLLIKDFDAYAKTMETGFAEWSKSLAAYAESEKGHLGANAREMLAAAAAIAQKASAIAANAELGVLHAPVPNR